MSGETVTMIDPDEGWRYGFPKVLPDRTGNIKAWLVENGYPLQRIEYFENATGYFPYRIYQADGQTQEEITN